MTASIAPTPMLAPAPTLAVKLSPAPSRAASPAIQHALPTPSIITSKEWVIPPRPKPGRKPATDIPPTKRKAQNRAAQRAFRERRAARVGELEEQLKQIEDEADREQADMQAQISRLQEDVDRFNGELLAWRSRAEGLEQALNHERSLKEKAEKEIECLRRGQTASTDAVPLPPRRKTNRKPTVSSIVSEPQPYHHQPPPPSQLPHHHSEPEQTDAPMGCGGCSTNARCACIEQAFNMTPMTYTESASPASTLKRAHSPQTRVTKRSRHTSDPVKTEPVELEIDFTSRFISSRSRISLSPDLIEIDSPSATVSPMTIPDPCGFCQDGTPCVCAELENANNNSLAHADTDYERERELENNRLAPLLAPFTPPPSDTDISNAQRQSSMSGLPQSLKPAMLEPSSRRLVSPMSNSKNSNPCANGPGTCAQCRADPNSTLFCKSLAASRAKGSGPPGGGCCGGGGASGGCCRSKPPAPSNRITASSSSSSTAPPTISENPAPRDISLSCADAYTTLARHAHFDRATDELNSWIGKLHTTATPPPPGASRTGGASALEVEAASVMGVLKYFDRRFGRE